MTWGMRYTFHAGYEPPARPAQFRLTLDTDDAAAQVYHAARQGVAGILYPWALDRPADEVERVAIALDETGLSCSCIISAESALLFTPYWSDRSEQGRRTLADATQRACKQAVALGTTVLAAFVMADAARTDGAAQQDDVVANLTDMATLAADHGLSLGLEPMLLPGLMFQTVGSAMAVIRRVDRANVGLIYDTAHVMLMEGALMPAFEDSFSKLLLLQLADLPGRVEPGAGTLDDLVRVAAEAVRRGYAGLVDLEHGWAAPSRQGETDGLARLRAFDARVQAAGLAVTGVGGRAA